MEKFEIYLASLRNIKLSTFHRDNTENAFKKKRKL